MFRLLALLALTAVQAEAADPPRARPIGNPADWFASDDYPVEAMRRESEGTVRFRLLVDATGQAVGCVVLGSSNDAALDSATCERAMARARFEPARDAGGNAVAGVYVNQVRWTLPNDPFLIGLEPVRIVNVLTADPDGLVTCDVARTDAMPPNGPGYACAIGFDHDQARRFARRFRDRRVQLWDSIGYAPGSAAEPPASRDPLGDLYFRVEAALGVAPDGGVSECRIVRRDRVGTAPGPIPPDVCAHYRRSGRRLFAPLPETQGLRTVRATHDYYLYVSAEPVEFKP